jgi:hypothetical protein
VPVPLPELNRRLTAFLESLPSQTRDQYVAMINDDSDQDS